MRTARSHRRGSTVQQTASLLCSNLWNILQGIKESSVPYISTTSIVFIRLEGRAVISEQMTIPSQHHTYVGIFEEYQHTLQNLDSMKHGLQPGVLECLFVVFA